MANEDFHLDPAQVLAEAEKEERRRVLELGRYGDFHALRYTWATFLRRNGIAQRFAMKLMRHSDYQLTAKVYTDETQLAIYDAIKGLLRLLNYTQIRAQNSGAAGQEVAQAGPPSEGMESSEAPVNGGSCRASSQVVTRGGDWSERRDSNPRHSPWQGDALPD